MQIVCRDVVIQEVPKYNKMYRDVVTRKVPKRKQNILRTKGMSELAPLTTPKQLRIAHTTFACSYISKTGHIYNHIRSDNVQVSGISKELCQTIQGSHTGLCVPIQWVRYYITLAHPV